ncbi:hypothetical protein CVIRNUC_005717 [Coccomyxa viridis]|uniref:Uncharacterized protein n=1 Tax=Coccomyxa viridis TaxID=1274662 RepID=A0AAV1I654_9CHLO|nr:hypothetical protein CVIRNUC_005717 [Coccomyxa viridis]
MVLIRPHALGRPSAILGLSGADRISKLNLKGQSVSFVASRRCGPSDRACNIHRQWRCITTAARKPQQLAEPVAREEGWEMSARASPTQGDALEEQLTSQVEQDAEAGLAGEVQEQLPSTSSRQVLEQPQAAVHLPARSRRRRKHIQAVLPQVQQPRTGINEGVKVGVLGIGALILLGAAFYVGRKLLSSQLPKVQKVMEQKQFQKEAAQRLNVMVDELRNSQNADLSAKNLGEEGCIYISEGLAFNDRCQAADLSKNGIGVKGVTALVEALQQNETLQTLVLDTNSIGDEGAEILAKHLSRDAAIRKLNLTGNNIGDKGSTVLAEMLKLNTTLVSLELNSNSIDYDGATALAEAISENTSLTSLYLSDNYIGALGAAVIANALSKNKSLRELHMKGNELGDEGVKALCKALKERQSPITSLDFGNNNISAEGAEAIADIVKRAHLKELNLYMNDIGDAGILKIASALEGDSSLVSLDVGGNNIEATGITALANALKGNANLKSLELGYNPIKEKGAQALADVVKYDLKVETLKMGWCNVGPDDGAKAVADLLMFNNTIATLDLRGNGLMDAGAKHLGRALKEHTNDKLTDLDLGYNEIKDEGACTLAQALKANPEFAPKELKVNANYITRFGQVALTEALDMVYEMGGGREIVITY